jgi:hypothetical protein
MLYSINWNIGSEDSTVILNITVRKGRRPSCLEFAGLQLLCSFFCSYYHIWTSLAYIELDNTTPTPTPTPGMLSHSHPPPSIHPTSTVVGNGSTLPVTSVGASVLPGPFYLNDILVAPHITHNLLSVCRFTTDNSCSIEFCWNTNPCP